MSKRHLQKPVHHTRTRLSVVPRAAGWAVEGFPSDTDRPYKTQREAIAAARKLIEPKAGGHIVVCGRDGRIRAVDTCVVGEDSIEKVNAVEDIRLSAEMKRDFRTLDRKRLTAEERRAWLIAKYGPRSDRVRRGA